MAPEAVLVFDLGTSSLKAGLFDEDGNRVGFVRLPYGKEIRPDYYGRSIETVLQTARDAAEALRSGGAFTVGAAVVGGNGPAWVALDGGGRVLGIPFSRMYESEAFSDVDSRYLRLLLAFFRIVPEIGEKAALFLPLSDYLPYFLTGEAVAALSCPGVQPLYWSEESCRIAGVSLKRLPGFVPTGERIGAVKQEAARFLGLPAGIPVYAGAPDYVMGLIGSGSMMPGAVFNRTGTSEAVNVVTDDRDLNSVPFWDGLNVDSVFLPETGARFGDWFFRYCSPKDSVTETAEALALRQESAFSKEAFAAGQRLLDEFAAAFRDAVSRLRRRGRVIEEGVIGGSQAESLSWVRRKAESGGVPLYVPRYAACELAGGAVLAAAAGNRGAVAALAAERARARRD